MKTYSKLLISLFPALLACQAGAAVSISYNAGFSGGLSSNLANAAGVVSNGLRYAIVVDAGGNGFSSTYNAVAAGVSGQLSLLGGGASDDYIYFASDLTSDSSQGGALSEGDFTTPGGNGGVSGIVNFTFAGQVTSGDTYRLVWFDSDGIRAGFLENGAFIIPPDGQAVSHDSAFVGVDPVRSATGLTFGIIPEPSTMALGALGALGLLRRRR